MNSNLVGIFSDAHSNIDAIQAMYSRESDVSEWICAGDSVGLFPCVNETMNLIRSRNTTSVLGDHEESLVTGKKLEHSFSGNESLRLQEKTISSKNLAYIKELSYETVKKISNYHFLILHDLNRGSGEKYHFDFESLSRKVEENIDFVIFGNTHIPTLYSSRKITFINPGSIGFPIQKFAKPSYAILNLDNREITFKTLDIQQERVKNALRGSEYNFKFNEYLENGYKWSNL